MREIPDCLNRRYKALDELINDLSNVRSPRNSDTECRSECSSEAGIKLMCDFWNILKDDPDCNLTQAVQQRMGIGTNSSSVFGPQRFTCYVAGKGKRDEDEDKRKETMNKIKNLCCTGAESDQKQSCCGSKSGSPSAGSDVLPLSKVLCNLKEAASFDKKCNARITELMAVQKDLQDQIQHLEHREKEGIQLLKQADCMWSCMEDTYKKKIAQSLEKQKDLLKQLKEVETSAVKWRKNKKDLDLQMNSINKCHQEITEKANQKTNDIKCIDMEIADFKKRIESNKNDTDNAKKSLSTKKHASGIKMASIAAELTRQQKLVSDENKLKYNKEQDGNKYVKDGREDLQKICRVLLQKKLENEDLKAEKEALIQEIELLNQTCDQCKEKCKNKQQSINDEIKIIDKEIAGFKVRCIRCHQCTDAVDIRKFCSDCPRCAEAIDCLYEDGHCSPDHTMDCVCMSVKQKFLDNVFDNMYTVLERQTKTVPGKVLADAILNCLRRSRNGKLNEETRKMLQDFILSTVKRNLNLTIVGGAVKTRCEMDPETYKQLMLCLKQVKAVRPPKEDKATAAKKESCGHWGGTSECNCPKGPKACVCTKKAPPPPKEPSPCPPEHDKEDVGEAISCPHKESTACGPDCAMHAVPSCVGTDVAAWRPDPCKEKSCTFSKSMRAAQCVLGPEALCAMPKSMVSSAPFVPEFSTLDDMIACKCGSKSTKPCTCRDRRSRPRERIIEEVMGRYVEVSPIEKVNTKQVKADNAKQSDKGVIGEQAATNVHRQYSYKETKVHKESYTQHDPMEQNELQKVPSVQTDIFSNVSKYLDTEVNQEPTHFSADTKNVSFDKPVEFQIAIDSGNGQLNNVFTKLTSTTSGNLAIELDDKVFALIEKKTQADLNLNISLNKTDSSRFILDFTSNNIPEKYEKISVRKSLSGTKLELLVNKYLLKKLMENTVRGIDEQKKDKPENILMIKKKTSITSDSCSNNGIPKCAHNYHLKDVRVNHKDDYLSELEEVYAKGNSDITIRVNGRNGFVKKMRAPLTRTLSGNVAVDMINILSFGEISFKTKELPVFMTKSCSGTQLLDMTSNNKPNAILRRTSSGGILVVGTNPVLKSIKTAQKLNPKNTNDGFFRVRVKSVDNRITEPPALLKSTPSHNYLIVLDKEYEKRFSQTINDYIGDDSECFVEMHKTNSGDYFVTLDDNEDIMTDKQNALLIKSSSGHIKVLVNEVVFETMEKLPRKISTVSAKAFGELLNKVPHSSKELHSENIRKTLLSTKSNSESQLYEKVKIKLPNQTLINEPSAILKKTTSGQYDIVLNKESKKAFINNLKSYLSGSHGFVPVRRTESGEITITLKENDNGSGNGSLKITSSGNIYVTVDETIIKGMSKEEKLDSSPSTVDPELSKHVIGSLKYPVNKTVTTTCNGNPDNYSCDISKCVCSELQSETDNWFQNNLGKKENVKLFQPQNCGIDWRKVKRNSNDGHKICDSKVYKNKCCPKRKKSDKYPRDKTPHIVIKPCQCRPVLEKNPRSIEECYIVEAICPYHIDRYQTVSNDLLEISGLCNKAQKEKVPETTYNIEPKDQYEKQTWNSLNFLPPQLPHFLRDISYP